MAGSTAYPRLTAAGDSANDAFLDAITAAVDSFDAYVAKVNDAATILAGDNTTFKMQGVNGPAVSGATRTVKVLGRPDSEHQVFLTVLNAISDTFAAYRTKVNANAAITGGDTTCYKVQALNGPTVSGATVFYRSDSRFDTDLDDTETQINGLVDALSAFASGWNLKQGGTPTTLVVSTVRRLRPMQRSSTGGGGGGGGVSDPPTRHIAIAGGNSQSATVATQPTTPLTVEVTDASNTPVEGDAVTWTISGNGSITTASLTNASGIASATPILGTLVESYTVTATSSTGSAVTFTLTATAGAAAAIEAASATDQSGTTSSAVAAPPSVSITDTYGNPVSGTTVTFAVTAGGGSRSPATVNSGSDGTATLTSWTLGASAGLNTLTATAAGLTGSPVTFNANASASAPTQIAVQSGGSQTGITAGNAATAVTFRVKDVSNNAVQGVTVAFTVTSGNGSLNVASAVTNASGDASVTYTTHTTVETATITGSFNAGSVSASTTIASTFGTKTKLALQTQPSSSGSSGTALSQQPIVLIQDTNGNTVTSATDTVTAAVQSGNATITAGSTKAAVAGVATFSGLTLTDTDGGSNVLRFSSGALTVVDSSGTTLAPPVPTALQFSGPVASVVEDTGILSATVNVVDASNVIVPGATNAVTISLTTPGGATLGGTTTMNAVSGVAAFTSDNTVDTPGTYTLTATATGLTSAVSTSFTVSAAGTSLTPNKPATITTYKERFWNAQNDAAAPGNLNVEGGWYDSTAHTWPQVVSTSDSTLVADMTSGQIASLYKGSNNTVGKSQFTGSGDGTSPTLSSFQNGASSGFNSDEVYASIVFAPSLNWDHITSYKLFQFSTHTPGTGANTRVGVVVHLRANQSSKFGDTTTPLTLDLVISVNTAGGTTEVRAASGTITRGSANHVEVYCKLNTNGSNDGLCKMWFNGVQVMNQSALGFRGGSATILGGDKFYLVNLYSSKGGPTTTDTIAAPCRLYYGYLGVGYA